MRVKGLHQKYIVVKKEDGSIVNDCFVLLPNNDPADLAALATYAEMTKNNVLAADLRNWIFRISQKND